MNPHWNILVRLWLQTFWEKRYLAFCLLVLFPSIGLAIGVLKPKKYRSNMTILVQESAKHNPFLEDLAVETRLKDRISALEALLHSRHVLLGVAVDLEMINEQTTPKEREEAVTQLSKNLSLKLIGDELVVLGYEQRTTDDIDRVLLAVAQRFMDKVLAPERSSISGSVEFLQQQIQNSAANLARTEEDLERFMSANADSLPELHAGNVRRLSELQLALAEKQTDLDGARAKYDILISRMAQTNPVVSRIEADIITLTTELASMRSRYTDSHSAVQSTKRKLDRLTSERNQLLEQAPKFTKEEAELAWTAAARSLPTDSGGLEYLLISQIEQIQLSKSEIAELDRQTTSLQREVSRLDRMVAGFGAIEKQMRQLRSDVDLKRKLHKGLIERADMARVTGALGKFEAPERVKIIDQPTIPTRPTGFPPLFFIAAGFSGAIGIIFSLVAISEITNSSVRTRAELANITSLPVLTRIPQLADPLMGFSAEKKPRTPSSFFLKKFRKTPAKEGVDYA